LVLKLAEARKNGTLERLRTTLNQQDLLILDEWGYVPWCYVKFSDKLNATFLTIIQPSAALISPFDPGIFSRTDPETDIHNDCVRGLYCKTY
jgi:hypothetical protein